MYGRWSARTAIPCRGVTGLDASTGVISAPATEGMLSPLR